MKDPMNQSQVDKHALVAEQAHSGTSRRWNVSRSQRPRERKQKKPYKTTIVFNDMKENHPMIHPCGHNDHTEILDIPP